MISIRENVFETNSSSCHSITICPTDLKEQLQNYQVVYTGNVEIAGIDTEYVLNQLDWSAASFEDDIKAKLEEYKSWGEPINEYSKKNWQWLVDHNIQSLSLKEICNAPNFSLFDVLQNMGIDYMHESYLFGGANGNDCCAENHYTDPTSGEDMTVSVIISET